MYVLQAYINHLFYEKFYKILEKFIVKVNHFFILQ